MMKRRIKPANQIVLQPDNEVRIKPIKEDQIFDEICNTDKTNILQYVTDIQTRLINIKKDAYDIGKLLTWIKKILAHGKFQPFAEHFFKNELSYNTAFFYMRIYKAFEGNPEIVKYIPTTYLLGFTNNDFPDEVLDHIKSNAHMMERDDLKQVNDAYKLFKNGNIKESQFIKLAQNQIKIACEVGLNDNKHRINMITRLSLELGGANLLKQISKLRKIARDMAGLHPHDPNSKGHKNLMNDIDRTIKELEGLKIDLEDRRGFIRKISTKESEKYIVQ